MQLNCIYSSAAPPFCSRRLLGIFPSFWRYVMTTFIANGYLMLADGATSRPAKPEDAIAAALRGQQALNLHEILGPDFWWQSIQDGVRWFLALVPQIIVALVLFFIFYMLYRVTRRLAGGTIRRAHVDSALGD